MEMLRDEYCVTEAVKYRKERLDIVRFMGSVVFDERGIRARRTRPTGEDRGIDLGKE
jgi:hypothetical protein